VASLCIRATEISQWLEETLELTILLPIVSQGLRRLVEIVPKQFQRPLARALRVSPTEALGMTEK
jgi:hypothetical protein